MTDSLASLTGAFAALLEVPALAASLRRNVELVQALGCPTIKRQLPSGVRPDIGRIAAALALAPPAGADEVRGCRGLPGLK